MNELLCKNVNMQKKCSAQRTLFVVNLHYERKYFWKKLNIKRRLGPEDEKQVK